MLLQQRSHQCAGHCPVPPTQDEDYEHLALIIYGRPHMELLSGEADDVRLPLGNHVRVETTWRGYLEANASENSHRFS